MAFLSRNYAVQMGSATVPVAPVGVSPTGQGRWMESLNGDPFGVERVFGETPNTATVTVALPNLNCIVTAKPEKIHLSRMNVFDLRHVLIPKFAPKNERNTDKITYS